MPIRGGRGRRLTTNRDRIPVTTVPRTIEDLERIQFPPRLYRRAKRQAELFLWRSHRLVVETDYWTYHRGSVAFEDDHARELDLCAAGYTVLRFTDRQLEGEAERVMAIVAGALAGS